MAANTDARSTSVTLGKPLARRRLLGALGSGSVLALLAACGGTTVSPTTATDKAVATAATGAGQAAGTAAAGAGTAVAKPAATVVAAAATAAPAAGTAAATVAGAVVAGASPAATAAAPGAAAATSAPAAKADGAKRRLSIATGGTGGVYYPYGGGLAKLISEKVPNTEATAEVTSASVDNLKFIGSGQADLAFTQGDTAYDAIEGRDKFTSKVPVRTLASLYTNPMHVVTTDGSGINTLADLKGKRVSVGAPNSGTEVMANRILEAAGLAERDITRERLSVAESAGAIKDKKIDAFFWAGGLPTGAVLDLANTPNFKLKLVPHDDVLDKLTTKFGPLYIKMPIPKDAYPGMTADVNVIGVSNLLVASEKMDADLVYAIVKAIHENKAQLDAVHPEAKNLTLQTAAGGSSAPFHPGAIKYYQERGVWKG